VPGMDTMVTFTLTPTASGMGGKLVALLAKIP
jgi:hypothetical protein